MRRILILFLIYFVLAMPVIANTKDVSGIGLEKVFETEVNEQLTDASTDSIIQQKNDVSPLDIASDRGLFILSPNQMIQMRILGSVRAAYNYSDQILSNKKTFNPYEIPTNIQTISPNFYAGLSQTRIGFEVTRKTEKAGDVFIRIEADFANSVNSFRIRHAYGQVDHFLFGQTWSLFNNVSFQPPTVGMSGPAGSIYLRTPQIRYSNTTKNIKWSVGIEYSTPDFTIPDTLNGMLLQVIPNFTGKITYSLGKFTGHIASIMTTMSGQANSGEIEYELAFGGSIAGKFNLSKEDVFYFSLTSGHGISHFFDVLRSKGQDAIYNSVSKDITVLYSTGGYVAYARELPMNLSSNLTFGLVAISNSDTQLANAYNYSYNAMLNVFWNPMEGARIGFEYAFGQRFDIGGDQGNASKFSMLLYYDF